MLEQIRLSGSLSSSSGFQAAWRPFSDWLQPNTSSAYRDEAPSSDKPPSPSGLSCLLGLTALSIHAPFPRFSFPPSISPRFDLPLFSAGLTRTYEGLAETLLQTHCACRGQSEMPFLDALAAESKALWKLGFKQSSLHHIAQVLQRRNRSVSVAHRFTSMLFSPRPFGFKSAR
jgi:hypothetical protein